MSKLYDDLEHIVKKTITPPNNGTTVYHYTDQHGYDGICRSMYLNINSHIYLNTKDSTNKELHTAYNLILDQLNTSRHEEIRSCAPIFKEYIKSGVVFYTVSFSNSQSIKLSQRFGEYRIDISSQYILDYISKTDNKPMYGNVEYNEKKQIELITNFFDIYDKDDSHDKYQKRCDLMLWLSVIMPLFKCKEHNDENEFRIIYVEGFNPDGVKNTPYISKKFPLIEEHLNKSHRIK